MATVYKVYCATTAMGVYYTEDFYPTGVQPHWTQVNTGLPNGNVYQFEVEHSPPYAENYQYALMLGGDGYPGDIYRRVNQGNWELSLSLAGAIALGLKSYGHLRWVCADLDKPGYLYALYIQTFAEGYPISGDMNGQVAVLKSTDFGENWVYIYDAGSSWTMEPGNISAKNDHVYFTYNAGIAVGHYIQGSSDGANSFDVASMGVGYGYNYVRVYATDENKALQTTWMGADFDINVIELGGSLTVTTKETTQAIVEYPSNLWTSWVDANHQRAFVHTNSLKYTTNEWGTISGTGQNNYLTVVTAPKDIETWIAIGAVAVSSPGHNVIATVPGDSQNFQTGRGGDNISLAPYTDSIPMTTVSGACAQEGIQFIEGVTVSTGVFVKDIEIGTTWLEEAAYRGTPLDGESATWDTVEYADKHARDIFRDQHLVHLPLGDNVDDVPVWIGDRWESHTGVYFGSFADHDHTFEEGSGGYLTEDYHDSYSDFEVIPSPDSPPADVARIYARDDSGTTKMYYKRTDASEIEFGQSADYLSINYIMDGGGSVISTGLKGHVRVDFDCIIVAWAIGSPKESGSIKIDIWKDTHGNFPPDDADSITGGHEPELASSWVAEDTDLSDWSSVAISAGDLLVFNVDSSDTTTMVTLDLKILST